MKCTLEIYGNSYESTEFSDRYVFAMVASASAGGINLKSLFEKVLGDKDTKESVLGKSGLDTLFSDFDFDTAERNIASILKKVFPTLDRPANKIDTAELILIISAMVSALVASNAETSEEPAATPKGTEVKRSEVLRTLGYRDEPTPTEKEPSKVLELAPTIKTLDVQPIAAIEPIVWEYPPGEIILHSTQEEAAIGYAAQVSGAEPAKVRCWYAWWQTVNEGESVTPAVAIEVLRDFTQQFTGQECGRYYALVTAHLENSLAIETPIAA